MVVGVARIVGTALAALVVAAPATAAPNLLVIVTDDQRKGTLNVMPATRTEFPIRFANYFVTTDLCCPSRATYLTGQYAHNHGVRTNFDYTAFAARDQESLGPWLHGSGYYTGFVGKYFNHFNAADGVPPGWDEFHPVLWGEGGIRVNDNCTKLTMRRKTPLGNEILEYANVYCTDLFADIAEDFIAHASDPAHNPEAKPWALFIWPNAPNVQTPPDRYMEAPLPSWNRPPSFLERDMSDKPAEVRRSPHVRNSAEFHSATRARQLRSLMAVDDLVEHVFATVTETGMSDSTWGIFTSDNGRFWGEHRLFGKLYGYEEGVAVPLRMRVPGMDDGAFRSFAGNIDIAPTLLDIAGAETTADFDGRSLLPLLEGKTWNRAMLAENWAHARYDALRTKRWRYVFWPQTRHRELYDRTRDPWELRNIASQHEGVVQRLHQTLRSQKNA